jgi:RecB family exonuclease
MAGEELFRLSHTKVETFRRCRKQYWFAYVSGMPRPEQEDTPAALAGNGVHRAMQKLCDTGEPEDGYAELEAYLRMPKHAAAGPGTEWWEMARAWYERGIDAHRSIASEARWAEVDSWAPAPKLGITVWSKADRVDRLAPDRWQVIDWKTGRFDLDDVVDRQLDLAHVIVRTVRALPREATVRAVAWNLRTGQQRVRELTREDAARTMGYLGRMARVMQAEEEFLATPGVHCGFCGWRSRCEAAARLEEEGLDALWEDVEEPPAPGDFAVEQA